MKQLFFSFSLLFSISLLISSCDKNGDDMNPTGSNDGSSNVVTTYCPEIDVWVADNYPNETIDSVLLVTTNIQNTNIEVYEVYLSNGVIATFNVNPVFGWPACHLVSATLPCGCPFSYEPVCWNNVTYDNECLAICAGGTVGTIEPGACGTCGCPTTYDPVCANGTTYDNECLAICDGADPAVIVAGACGPCGCPTNYDPVCGDGVNYDNECLALCDGVAAANIVPGTCPVNGTCNVLGIFPTATVVNVIEGYANVNYGNAYYAIELDFSGTLITVHFTQICDFYAFCSCDTTVDIVCAGGINYLNPCFAECDGHLPSAITPGPC